MPNEGTQDEVEVSIDQNSSRNIYQRLNAVQQEVAYLKRDKMVGAGKNAFMVATYDNLIDVVRDHLVKHGIALEVRLVPGSEKLEFIKVSGEGYERVQKFYHAHFDVVVVNIDKPDERIVMTTPGSGDDANDKACGKAHTYATKSALKKLLLIHTGEEEESAAPDPAPDPAPERQRPQAVAPATNGEVPSPAPASPPAGKPASPGEIVFAKNKVGERLAAFCKHLGIANIDDAREGVAAASMKFMRGQ